MCPDPQHILVRLPILLSENEDVTRENVLLGEEVFKAHLVSGEKLSWTKKSLRNAWYYLFVDQKSWDEERSVLIGDCFHSPCFQGSVEA